jgi:hypothetical protein
MEACEANVDIAMVDEEREEMWVILGRNRSI